MKLIKMGALRQVDRNLYMSVWSAQRKGYIKKYFDDNDVLCYDPKEYAEWHKNCRQGRRSKFRPLTGYRIDELLKMNRATILEKNTNSNRPFTQESVDRLIEAVVNLNNSELYKGGK